MNDHPPPWPGRPTGADVLPDRDFVWTPPDRPEAVCGLELWRLYDGRAVAIVSERAENRGLSVTNGAEWLAAEVCRRYQLEPRRLVWLEHYPAQPLPRHVRSRYRNAPPPPSLGRQYRATWDLATFPLVPVAGGVMIGSPPTWRPATAADFLELGATPPPGLEPGALGGVPAPDLSAAELAALEAGPACLTPAGMELAAPELARTDPTRNVPVRGKLPSGKWGVWMMTAAEWRKWRAAGGPQPPPYGVPEPDDDESQA